MILFINIALYKHYITLNLYLYGKQHILSLFADLRAKTCKAEERNEKKKKIKSHDQSFTKRYDNFCG